MHHYKAQLKNKLHRLSQAWITRGLPSRERLERAAEELSQWKQQHEVNGIWAEPPLMATATLDDGIGQGIEIISLYAQTVGLHIRPLGLVQQPATIIAACRQYRPAILGLTILQLDSDAALARIGHNLPQSTALVAGGPVFKYDPEMAQRCNVTYVAANVAYFINFLLNWEPVHDPPTG